MVQVLPDVGFTLWNPPPACSLALLLIKGFQFAPALFPAAVLADGLNGGFSIGVMPTLVMDAIIAAGYSTIAAALRPFAGAATGFRSVRDVVGFLGVVCVGVLAVAGLVGVALVLLHELPPDRLVAAVRHFWIGDITGIVGLFPMLMTRRFAWERWRELRARTRFVDFAVFALALASALWIVFEVAAPKEFQFFYLLLLPMIWIGVRHGLPCCAVAILIEQLALIAVVVLYDYSTSDFTDFQLLSLAIAITGLLLGAVVTERQHTELRLRQQQAELGRMARLTTAGALGSAIVHQISQPLATIATYVHACRVFLVPALQNPEFLSATLAKVESETLRAGEIVERLRDFLSKGDTRFVPLDLAQVAHAVVAVLADDAQLRRVEVSILAQSVVWVTADRLQMEQVLLNLIRNGIEAAAENATREKHVWVSLDHLDDEVQVAVEDNGPGVHPEIAEQLFEPFTTRKARGMGLGLSLSRQIVELHGGDLWWDRTVATGARFAFRLPIHRSSTNAR
jgi:two-component system, LuxR family, sensor kinase FixL